MVAMSIFKNTIFNLSKSFYENPSVSNVSRVCFASASRYSEGRNSTDDDKKGEHSSYNADEAVDEPGDITSSDKNRDAMKETMDKTKEYTNKSRDAMKETMDKTKEYSKDAKEKTEDVMGTMTDKTKGVAETVSGKAKETVDGAWGAAKKTAQKVKETVVGKASPDDTDDFIEDHIKKPTREGKEKVMDEDVVDTRRQYGEEKGL